MAHSLQHRPPVIRDLRFGLRVLARNPAFAAAALGVMSLGIGATTAVFSIVRAVLLEALPYREAALSAIAILASAVPAIRAVRIDPMLSLRAE